MSSYLPDDVVIPDLYATPADYTEWTGKDAPDNVLPILRACTGLVIDATEGDYYDIDPATGLPSTVRLVGALRDATCAQAAAWVTLGIDPAAGGVQQTVKGAATTRKIGSAVITRSDSETSAVAAATAAAAAGLVPEAWTILRRHGLGSATVRQL